MAKEKIENFYKALGTTAKISDQRIKEKYIEAVKKHPPETDPDGFETVRRAYETLKDPDKRKQYDMYRKYGNKVEAILDKAFRALGEEDYKKAEELFEQSLIMQPVNPPAIAGMIKLHLSEDNLEKAQYSFEKAKEVLGAYKEELVTIYMLKFTMLIKAEFVSEAIKILKEGKEQYPDFIAYFNIMQSSVFFKQGNLEKAWKAIDGFISAPDNNSKESEDMLMFFVWAKLMVVTKKWDAWSRVQSRLRKFFKTLTEQEDREDAFDLFMDEADDLFDEAEFRSAEVFMNLAKMVADPNDSDFKESLQDIKKLARLEKEITRLENDDRAFPLLFFQAYEWFYEDYLPEQVDAYLNSIPVSFMEALKNDEEEYAAAIMMLRKKYPLIYKEYKDDWDTLFAELTKGFNREMRRELRKMK